MTWIKPGFNHMGLRHGAPAHAPDHASKGCHHIRRQAHGLANIAQGRARPIADHCCRQRRLVTTKTGINILNNLFAPLMLKIHVDVWRLAPFGRNKAFKQKINLNGVDRRDA